MSPASSSAYPRTSLVCGWLYVTLHGDGRVTLEPSTKHAELRGDGRAFLLALAEALELGMLPRSTVGPSRLRDVPDAATFPVDWPLPELGRLHVRAFRPRDPTSAERERQRNRERQRQRNRETGP